MNVYTLHRKQFLPIPLQTAWDFFSTPSNLREITPKHMNFRILSNSGGDKMHEGQIIKYKITVIPLIRITWVTEITHVKYLDHFCDEQRVGPYALWKHLHTFREVAGGLEMTDKVEYAIPLGILGEWAHRLFVDREVNRIFDYRFKVLEEYFCKP